MIEPENAGGAAALAPPSDWRRAGAHDHFVRFYDDDATLVDLMADYIGGALRDGACAIVIATGAHLAGMERRLAERGIDHAGARAQGRCIALDARETLERLLVDGRPDRHRFAEVIGGLVAGAIDRGGEVMAFGEMVALLCEDGRHAEAVRLEELWNELARAHRFTLCCAYPTAAVAGGPDDIVREVCAQHGLSLPTEGYGALCGENARLAYICDVEQKARRLAQEVAHRHAAERLLAAREDEAERVNALLAAIVSCSDDAILSKSLDGCISSWNAGAERLFGYTAGEAIGQSVLMIVPPECRDEERDILAALAQGRHIDHFETVRVTRDGSRIDVSLTISPIRDRDGRIVGASNVARDISERKRIEEQLRLADRRKDEFIAMLGHELRNPLAPIRTVAEVLRRTMSANPQFVQLCGILERQVQQMTRLLDDLLDVTRITQGRIRFKREPTDIALVVQRAVEATRPLFERRGHKIDVELPDGGLPVRGDFERLVQLATNLLNNAAKYTPDGGHIGVRVVQSDKTIAIHVRDDGVGISPGFLPRVFELFVQDPACGAAQDGLGVGLALVRIIAEHHGGSAEAHSAGAGRGSEFVVTLPLDAREARPGTSPAGSQVAAPPGRRIVIVDDNRDASTSLAMLLRLCGHDVSVAAEPAAAIAMIQDIQPDLVLLDIGLPGMSGYEVARRLRQAGCAARLAAVTGYGTPRDRERSRAAGFDHHFVKPVDPASIEQLLQATPVRAAVAA